VGWPRIELVPAALQGKTAVDADVRDYIDARNMMPVSIELATINLFALEVGDPAPAEAARLRAALAATPRLSYYVSGPGIRGSIGNHWHHVQGWPADIAPRDWYLAAGGRLAREPERGVNQGETDRGFRGLT
jgi:hypothetical protein